MHPREVPEVGEVLELARRVGSSTRTGRRCTTIQSGSSNSGIVGQLVARLLHRHPQHARSARAQVNASTRALPGTRVGSASCGISLQMPSPPYCQPWYGHMIRSPTTRPSESAVPRWMQRSRSACGDAGRVAPQHEVLAEQPHPQRRVAQRVRVRDRMPAARAARRSRGRTRAAARRSRDQSSASAVHDQLDLDVAARGVRVGADLVGGATIRRRSASLDLRAASRRARRRAGTRGPRSGAATRWRRSRRRPPRRARAARRRRSRPRSTPRSRRRTAAPGSCRRPRSAGAAGRRARRRRSRRGPRARPPVTVALAV